MANCSSCGSHDVKYAGMLMRGKEKMVKLSCQTCGNNTYVKKESYDEMMYEDSDEAVVDISLPARRVVITCSVLGYKVNETFLSSLENYCTENNATLFVIPIKYKNADAIFEENNELLSKYYLFENINFGNNFKIMGGLKLNASMEHPLSGLDPLSKGNSIVFGHPQVALKTVPTEKLYPAILTTTGCVTEKFYTGTKQGLKANFNHSYSAVVLELDSDDEVHLRHLNFDGEGFYDITKYYTSDAIIRHYDNFSISALVTGDEHVMFQDKTVAEVTYTNPDSIVKTLYPKNIVRHDVLDAYTVSHHHKHNVFTKFAKFKDGDANSIEQELKDTIEFIISTTPDGSKSLIVSSNHNDHLLRWLNECDPQVEPWNAEIYHWFMYKMLKETKMGESGAEYPNPFKLYFDEFYGSRDVEFIGRNEAYMINEVAINNHGDKGINGARGSRAQFSKLPVKTIVGHSHSPGITHGVYQCGTSSKLKLEYNSGPSSWHHCHCIIYPNGKRQLLFIINGKWRA